MDINKIICGESSYILKNMIPDDFFDLILTSPPYSSIRDYQGFEFDFEKIALELTRILKPGGIICWIINDQYIKGSRDLNSFKQAIFFKETCGLRVHDVMIYQKKNFSNPSFNRYHQIYEYILILSKGKPKTFNPLMDRKNLTSGSIGNLGINSFTQKDGSKSIRTKKVTKEYGMRHNIWCGLTAGQENMCLKLKHPAQAPKWLCRDLIKSWSNVGNIVLDPFCGSGTTLVEAKKLNRNFIGIEISKDYYQLSEKNLSKVVDDNEFFGTSIEGV